MTSRKKTPSYSANNAQVSACNQESQETAHHTPAPDIPGADISQFRNGCVLFHFMQILAGDTRGAGGGIGV